MEDKVLINVYRFQINYFSNIWWSAVSDDKNICIGDIVLITKDNIDFKKGTYAEVIDVEEKALIPKNILDFNRIIKFR
jgi:hypothetical protein